MKSAEKGGGAGPTPVEVRSRELAECEAVKAANEAVELFQYLEPVVHGDIEAAETAVYYRKVYDIMEQRDAGLMNDEHSIAPGITALVKDIDIECLEKIKDAPFALEEVESPEGWLFRLSFPEGAYRLKKGVVELGGSAVFENGEIIGMSKHWSGAPDQIIRIEGHSGELWQNPDYYADGTRRDSSQK
jgi:hypothetical protein